MINRLFRNANNNDPYRRGNANNDPYRRGHQPDPLRRPPPHLPVMGMATVVKDREAGEVGVVAVVVVVADVEVVEVVGEDKAEGKGGVDRPEFITALIKFCFLLCICNTWASSCWTWSDCCLRLSSLFRTDFDFVIYILNYKLLPL